MAYFQPVIGSSFSDDTGQQFNWQGRNDSVDRANLNSQVQAQDAANSWLAQQQARQDQMAREQAAARANAIAAQQQNALALYQFNAEQANKDAETKIKADNLVASIAQGKQGAASDALKQSYAQANQEAQLGTFDTKNYPTLPPDETAYLSRINALVKAPQDQQKQQQAQSYFGAVKAADEGNTVAKINADQNPTAQPLATSPANTWASSPGYFDLAQKALTGNRNPLDAIVTDAQLIAKPLADPLNSIVGGAGRWLGTYTPPDPIQPSEAAVARLAAMQSLKQPIKGLTTTSTTTGQLIPDPSLTVPPSYFASRGAPAVVTPTNANPQIQPAPPAAQRIIGVTYSTPKGNLVWTGVPGSEWKTPQ
jgi:hypothetical protein